jgi:hypothetical protein
MTLEGHIVAIRECVCLIALGLRIPGIPRVLRPFNYPDLRAFLNQSVFNWINHS